MSLLVKALNGVRLLFFVLYTLSESLVSASAQEPLDLLQALMAMKMVRKLFHCVFQRGYSNEWWGGSTVSSVLAVVEITS